MDEGRGRSIAPGAPAPAHSPTGEHQTPLAEGTGYVNTRVIPSYRRAFTRVPRLWRGVISASEHLPQSHAVLYTEGFGVQRQSQGINLMMSDHVNSVQERGSELWPACRMFSWANPTSRNSHRGAQSCKVNIVTVNQWPVWLMNIVS